MTHWTPNGGTVSRCGRKLWKTGASYTTAIGWVTCKQCRATLYGPKHPKRVKS